MIDKNFIMTQAINNRSYDYSSYIPNSLNIGHEKQSHQKSRILWDYKKQGRDWNRCISNITNRQSPININISSVSNEKEKDIHEHIHLNCNIQCPIKIEWSHFSIIISPEKENENFGYILKANKTYEVSQFHFHSPAEHTFDYIRRPLEMHIVSKNKDIQNTEEDNIIVVGITFEEKNDDLINEEENMFLKNLLKKCNFYWIKQFMKKIIIDEKNVVDLNLLSLFSAKKNNFFLYKGSLTTPPCSENVTWYILKDAIMVNKNELKKFREILKEPDTDGNYRIIQNSPEVNCNNRMVYSSIGNKD